MTNPELSIVASLLQDSLVAGHIPYLTVTSGSMAPLLRIGDQVGMQQVALEHLRLGDIVVVCHLDVLLTHRFYGMRHNAAGELDGYYVTRGDRLRGYDPVWNKHQLVGRVVVRRRGGQLMWLDYGRGLWLNRRLAQLAQVEQKTTKKLYAHEMKQQLPERLVRIGFRALATGLARTIEYIP